jgi:hypothetical protein
MAIPSSDGPRDGSSTTSTFLPLNTHFSFSSLFKACLLSYSKSGYITSTSKGNYEWDSHGGHHNIGFHEMQVMACLMELSL